MATILVIDDEAEMRRLARMILSRHGHTVLEESEAQAGIAVARERLPDLILMDISMPALDGWTVTRVLKADPALTHIPIVAWTALSIGGEGAALAAGYDGYLPKPVKMAQFVDQVTALLPGKQPEPELPSGRKAPASATSARPALLPPDATPIPSLAEAQVLLLTDNEGIRREIGRKLVGQGYRRFVETSTVAAAIEVAQARPLDLVLLDLDLNEADGFEVLRRLRSEACLKAMPVILIADSARSNAVHGLSLGADDYVLKPINWEELSMRVSSRLHIKLLEESLRRRQTDLEVLYRASQVLSASLDPATVLAQILEQATASVEATQGSLYLLDANCMPIWQLHTSGVPGVPPEKLETLFKHTMADWVCGLLEPVVIDNTPDNPHELRMEGDTRTHSSLIVPLVGREGVLGILLLDHDEAGHFTPEHMAWLAALAAQAAIALDNARLFENVRNERRKLSAILDSSADAIVVVDDDMRIVLLNAAARQAMGLDANSIGHSVKNVLSNDNPMLALFDFATLRGEQVSLEVNIGQGIYDATIRPVQGIGYVAALHDIHLLKEMEQMELERQRQETERVKRKFARYFSPQVAEVLLRRGETLGTLRKCNAAMLFSDLRNFTALTERIGIEAMTEYVLKRYITVMTDMIYAHEGTINKILGDGIMAVFGVPIEQSNAPQRALRAALAMQRALGMLRQGWLRELNQDINMGIGLAWGEVIAGDIGGSSELVDYTVIGDAVNLAARLGEMAGPGEVLLTETLAEVVGGDSPEWRLEELPPMEIKGKEKPQRVYRAVPAWE